jgi:uncharacterized protein YwgA
MFERYAKVAFVVETCGGSIDGRKKLQKLVYIAKVLGYPFGERFTLYWYGPYSHELAAEVKRMTEFDILNERKPDFSYLIRLTSKGKAFLNDFRPTLIEKVEEERYEKMKDLFASLNKYDSRQLELLATLLYFCKIGSGSMDAVKGTVRTIKPKFSAAEIDEIVVDMVGIIREYHVG